jgi:KUP system potassium uptake protein
MSSPPATAAAPTTAAAASAVPASRAEVHGRHTDSLVALAIGALGVVYGDIGTSPLYALRECFNGPHAVPVSVGNVLGVLSLMFWSLVCIISIKYVTFVTRADNEGEGGTMALLARLPGGTGRGLERPAYFVLPLLFGASLLYGDGLITPAISVLSAVEGIAVQSHALEPWIIPLTCIILATLFLAQRFGTAGVASVFGPVMSVWFVVIAVLGLVEVIRYPDVLTAVDPRHAVRFIVDGGWHAFLVLGAVVLCVTGGEALYADMGHFGRKPIRWAWYGMVMPALLLNYFGQGALILHHPSAAKNSFYGLVPEWGHYPMVVLATAAAVIASQALISGVFSLTNQATQLGFWPRMNVVHTSETQEGQIYLPGMNYALMVGCLILVLSFGSSSKLAATYGIAVTGDMIMTSIGFFAVARLAWKWPLWQAGGLVLFFLFFDVSFFTANIVKVDDGGWVPLLIGAGIFTVMTTWYRGRQLLSDWMRARTIAVDDFVRLSDIEHARRVPGTAVFLTSSTTGVPPVLRHHFEHNQVLHEQVVLLSIVSMDVPFVSPRHRLRLEEMPHGFYRLIAYFGFMETPKVPAVLEACAILGLAIDPVRISYYLGRESLIPATRTRMRRWRKRLFSFCSRNARSATAYFGIPPNRVVEMGMQIEL